MEMYVWNTFVVLSKVVFYVGFFCIAGYTFFRQTFVHAAAHDYLMSAKLNWMTSSVVLAFIANAIWFFASTGAMAEEGIQGALDPDMLSIMWGSSIGDGALFRGIGLIMAIIAVTCLSRFKSVLLNKYVKQSILVCSLLILAYTFTLLGHVSEFGVFEKVLLMLHVFVMAWWFGALFPIKQACHVQDYKKLYLLMEKFGKQASVVVSMLLVSGLLLAIKLVGSVEVLLSSSYGQALLFKLSLVVSILCIAAKHKLKLVPHLKNNDGRKSLSRSISIEMIVAFAILSVTSGLTSVVGPAN